MDACHGKIIRENERFPFFYVKIFGGVEYSPYICHVLIIKQNIMGTTYKAKWGNISLILLGIGFCVFLCVAFLPDSRTFSGDTKVTIVNGKDTTNLQVNYQFKSRSTDVIELAQNHKNLRFMLKRRAMLLNTESGVRFDDRGDIINVLSGSLSFYYSFFENDFGLSAIDVHSISDYKPYSSMGVSFGSVEEIKAYVMEHMNDLPDVSKMIEIDSTNKAKKEKHITTNSPLIR